MLRRPVWAIGTLICLALVVLFVNFGFWQLRRLDERRDRNELLEIRLEAAPVPVESLLSWGTLGDEAPEAAEHRRVVATGRWQEDSTLLVRSRALAGAPGYHVLGTLVLDLPGVATVDPLGVVVNRGFAPLGRGDEDVVRAAVEPPAGEVTIEGVLRATETRAGIGPTDPSEGTLTVLNRVDLARIQVQSSVDLAPMFVHQTAPESVTELPQTLPLPDTSDEGPHLSYAGQWFLFAMVGAVGWPILLRRAAKEPVDDDDNPPAPSPPVRPD